MRRTYLAWLAAFAVCLTAWRASAQYPPPIPVPFAPAVAVPERTDPPSAAVPASPTQPPGAPGAFQSLQALGNCPSEPQATRSGPPPFGGSLWERPNLLGDWCGARTRLRDCGVTLDVYSTNFYAGVASGGLQEQFRYRGRMDYLLNVDGEKAGLWKGSFLTLHGETVYGDSINQSTGALLPAVLAEAVPQATGYVTALTGVKFTQFLSESFLLYAGKINTLDDFYQPFTGGARGVDGFMNTGFLFNPVYDRTIPYSTYGAGFAYLKNLEPVFSFAVMDATDSPTTSGFDTFFRNGAVLYSAINIPSKFFGLPGHQGISGTYSSRSYTSLDRSAYINAIILNTAAPTKTGSWSLTYNLDQAVYVDPQNPKRSWGLFGNLGLADQNPSPFRWFASIGLGGSSPLQSRKLDTFGIGYYYLGLSPGLRNLAPVLLPLRDEQAVEVFYNIAITPWCRITPDLQVVFPARKDADTALFLGLRAKLDF